MVRIAIDCMGGDGGPSTMVNGAVRGAKGLKDVHLMFVGPKQELESIISTQSMNDITYEIIDAPDKITNEDSPVLAVRRKKDSSLVKAALSVREGTSDALITSGSTGAFLSAGLLIVGRMSKIRRPALAAVLPVIIGANEGPLLLDCGANMDATSEDLYNYAIMGNLYAQYLLKRKKPSIALLNVGPESKKGNQVVKDTFERLSESELNFIGNIEARDLMNGPADVVICDGFAGNIALKTFEGVATSLFQKLKDMMLSNFSSKIGAMFLKPTLLRLREDLDYNKHGGGILLGLNGLCIKCHGSASADAVEIAVKQAHNFVTEDILNRISTELN